MPAGWFRVPTLLPLDVGFNSITYTHTYMHANRCLGARDMDTANDRVIKTQIISKWNFRVRPIDVIDNHFYANIIHVIL